MKTKLRTKQQGDLLVGAVTMTILVGCLFIAVAFHSMLTRTISMQEVQELEQKCTQAGGEAVINVNTKQEPKFVQCKLSGVLYNKF